MAGTGPIRAASRGIHGTGAQPEKSDPSPDPRAAQVGAKLTGIYFATSATTGGGGSGDDAGVRERSSITVRELSSTSSDGRVVGGDPLASGGTVNSGRSAGGLGGSLSLAFAAMAALGLRRRAKRSST